MAKTPKERPPKTDPKAAIETEVEKAIKTLGGGTDVLQSASDYSPAELVDALRKLGARSDLLGIVGSWGDTKEDAWVLENLRRWNANHLR